MFAYAIEISNASQLMQKKLQQNYLNMSTLKCAAYLEIIELITTPWYLSNEGKAVLT